MSTYNKCSYTTQGDIVCSYQDVVQPQNYATEYESLDIHNQINKNALQYQLSAFPDDFLLVNPDSELLKS